MINIFLDKDELTQLITKIDLLIGSVVKYLT